MVGWVVGLVRFESLVLGLWGWWLSCRLVETLVELVGSIIVVDSLVGGVVG